jgi:hypothetical protein
VFNATLNTISVISWCSALVVKETGVPGEYHTCSYVMMSNTTFNNISVISLRSVLFVDETGLSGEKHRPVASH